MKPSIYPTAYLSGQFYKNKPKYAYFDCKYTGGRLKDDERQDEQHQALIQQYAQQIQPVSGFVSSKLLHWLEKAGFDAVQYAIGETACANTTRWSYTEAVICALVRDNALTSEAIAARGRSPFGRQQSSGKQRSVNAMQMIKRDDPLPDGLIDGLFNGD